MRTTAKILAFVAFASIACGSVSAYSPFSSILNRAPEIAVTDIHQETRFVYMRVCNLGGSIADSSTSLGLAMKRTGGGVVSSVESVLLDTNECHEFQMASVDDLGITTSGTYEISAGAILKDGRAENVKDNNKIIRSVNIIYPSKYSGARNYYGTDNGTYYNNSTYGNSTTYYCIPGTSNCSTTPYSNYYNNNSSYCTSSNNYCNNSTYYNGSYTYYRNNICPTWDYSCNYDYYNSTNTPYQYNNSYCTYSNNYCNTNTYYNNNSGYYNNSYYELPDLVVQRIYQNSGDKYIIAQICNQGGDMKNSVSLRTNFSSPNSSSRIYNSVQMSRGQCTSTVVYTTPGELDITYSGNYSISVTADAGNSLGESNESNNTRTQSFFVETNRNQKSDLVVDRISANDNNRTVVAHVCNIGDDMLDYNNWVMEVSNTSNNSTTRNSGYRLYRGQCADVATSYSSLGIYRSGSYNIRVVVDPDNAISEQSRYNNSLSQYLQIWMNSY